MNRRVSLVGGDVAKKNEPYRLILVGIFRSRDGRNLVEGTTILDKTLLCRRLF